MSRAKSSTFLAETFAKGRARLSVLPTVCLIFHDALRLVDHKFHFTPKVEGGF